MFQGAGLRNIHRRKYNLLFPLLFRVLVTQATRRQRPAIYLSAMKYKT